MEIKKKHRIIFTGGGSGGHIFPLVAIIRELRRLIPKEKLEICYIGPQESLSKEYLEKEDVLIKYISTGKIRRMSDFKEMMQNIIDIVFRVPLGLLQSFIYIYIFSPDIIFGKGGHGSFPVITVSKIFDVPVILHESDAIMGTVNQRLQSMATEVFTSFPKIEKVLEEKMLVVGNPIREEVLKGNLEKGKEIFEIKNTKPTIFIIGGSQGSERINDLFLSASTGFLENFNIIHQCGKNNYKSVFAESNAIIKEELRQNYRLFAFLTEEQIAHAYALADIVISRAGSGSIFEIAAAKKAGVFLPLPEAAQGHQVKNAYIYTGTGAGIVLEQENLTSHFFLEKIKELFSPIEQIRIMERSAGEFARPRAAYIIASYLEEYLQNEE
jgi:UDP-N-acetylglucosamine--N-acetylmuramyl-(pentapeptide) pyrophosphoryl-undecaprenol N-acetylglucosamine transferase